MGNPWLRLRIEQGLDAVDELQSGFGGFGGVEVEGKKKKFDAGMAEAEPLEKRTVGLRAGAADDERGLGGLDERGGVAEVFRGEDIVAGAF